MIRYNNITAFTSVYLGNQSISKVYSGDKQVFPSSTPPTPSYSGQYLTFVAQESGTFTFTPLNSNIISYSLDSGSTWTQGNSVSVNNGQNVMWKGEMTPSSNGIGTFSSTSNFTVEGNPMSLHYGDNFSGQTSLSGKDYAFSSLFSGCSGMTSAENLSLIATTLADNCYYYMFSGCKSLTTAPQLPATTLADRCYQGMFQGCTSLTTAPSTLPATTLANNCYQSMFRGCSGLTTAPVLSATTLTNQCYQSMFSGCTSLNSITCLATDISASNCTTNWVYNVASAGTFIRDCNTEWTDGNSGKPNNWVDNCSQPSYADEYLTFVAQEDSMFKFGIYGLNYSLDSGATWVTLNYNQWTPTVTSGNSIMFKSNISSFIGYNILASGRFIAQGNPMSLLFGDNFSGQTSLANNSNALYGLFSDCTSLISAENLALPATTLANSCYKYMFQGCINLTTAPTLPATVLAGQCYYSMFEGCTSLTTAPQLPATALETFCYSSMFKGCINLTKAPSTLPATTLATYCYTNMFEGCTSLTTAPVLSATTLASNCCNGMFQGCTSLTTAPSLLATTLADDCYRSMFQGCTSLTTAPSLLATTLAGQCYYSMFYGCTSLTTAPQLPATTLTSSCYQQMFGGCSNLNRITCLATDISASYCTLSWVSGVAASGTFVKAESMNNWTTGNSGIPNGWTVVDNT